MRQFQQLIPRKIFRSWSKREIIHLSANLFCSSNAAITINLLISRLTAPQSTLLGIVVKSLPGLAPVITGADHLSKQGGRAVFVFAKLLMETF